jgi:hypothetical protein
MFPEKTKHRAQVCWKDGLTLGIAFIDEDGDINQQTKNQT